MKTYLSERHPNKLAKAFIKENLLAMIVVEHAATDTYRVYVYRSQKQILIQPGRLNRLKSDRQEIDNQYLDAAVLEMRLVTDNLNIPIRVVS
jgi:hypothetical protein